MRSKFLSSPPNLQKGLAKNTLLIPSGKNYSVVLILILVKIENALKKYMEKDFVVIAKTKIILLKKDIVYGITENIQKK